MTTIDKELLKVLHTKQLLRALRKCCVDQHMLNLWYPPDGELSKFRDKELFEREHTAAATCFGYEDYVGSSITIADLKAELATREHVPNKVEAKEIRRAKAKAKKNR